MERNQIRKTKYLRPLTENDKLAVQTCPGYNKALDRALKDTDQEKHCTYLSFNQCPLSTWVQAAQEKIIIKGSCADL